jgi:BASS family bile acid:Na+ symporter
MTAPQLVALALQGSMVLVIFCVGLEGSFEGVTYLLRKPGLLARSLVSMNVVMPIFALALAVLFDLRPALEAALLALALSPVPPVFPKVGLRAGGAPSYIIGVLTVTAIFSIVFVPLAVEVVGKVFSRPIHASAMSVAKIVATSMLLPLVVGACVRWLGPSMADKITRPLATIASALLLLAFVAVLIEEWRPILSNIGQFTLVAAIVFVVVGLAVGHLMGGPDPKERTVLALSTSTRHPAVALAIAHDFPDKPALFATVLLVLLVGLVVSGPYVKWRKRHSNAAR